jgi:transcriptional regulator with XRE-family HTH domain
MSDGGELGIPCQHLYAHEKDIPKNSADASKEVELNNLKGVDAFIYAAAVQLGLQPRILKMIDSFDGGEEETYVIDYVPTLEEAHRWRSIEMMEGHRFDHCISCEELPNIVNADMEKTEWLSNITWCHENGPRGVLLDDVTMSATGYFGNEACEGTIYQRCAVILSVPDSTSPLRQRFLNADGAAIKRAKVENAAEASIVLDAYGTPDLVNITLLKKLINIPIGPDNRTEEMQSRQRLSRYEKGRPHFSLEEVKEMAAWLGVSTAGSKTKVVTQINKKLRQMERESDEALMAEYGVGDGAYW